MIRSIRSPARLSFDYSNNLELLAAEGQAEGLGGKCLVPCSLNVLHLELLAAVRAGCRCRRQMPCSLHGSTHTFYFWKADVCPNLVHFGCLPSDCRFSLGDAFCLHADRLPARRQINLPLLAFATCSFLSQCLSEVLCLCWRRSRLACIACFGSNSACLRVRILLVPLNCA